MADKELLEAAAQAAGIVVDPNTKEMARWTVRDIHGNLSDWSPLIDDGDALRLGGAIGMQMQIRKQVGMASGEVEVTAGGNHVVEGYTGDCMPAIRRAIVRAAAAMQTPV